MVPMVAVIAVPVVVRAPVVIAVVPIRSVVSVRIIAVSIRRIVTIPIARITNSNSDRNLRIRTLRGNEGQSACHHCN